MVRTMYNLPEHYFKYFGWFVSADQPADEPTHDPGLGVGCPFCSEPLTEDCFRTVSIMAWGGVTSFFYRGHPACIEVEWQEGNTFELILMDAIPADDQNPDVHYAGY